MGGQNTKSSRDCKQNNVKGNRHFITTSFRLHICPHRTTVPQLSRNCELPHLLKYTYKELIELCVEESLPEPDVSVHLVDVEILKVRAERRRLLAGDVVCDDILKEWQNTINWLKQVKADLPKYQTE